MRYVDAFNTTTAIDRLDVEILLATVLRVSRSHLYAWPEKCLTSAEIAQFTAWVERRANGEPLAYIIGEKEFWSLTFTVNHATLIPRPETETLITTALKYLPNNPCTVIDLGTGSGAIAVSLAHERPAWHIIAIDDNKDALNVAKLNAKKLVATPLHFIQTNWLACCRSHSVDAIVSNPPYIAANDPHLAALRYEPEHALISGNEGLSAIDHILQQARHVLRPRGWLIFEHGYDQGARVAQLFSAYGYQDIQQEQDLLTHARVTLGRTPC